MICPYNRKSEVQVLQWRQGEQDGDTFCEQKTVTKFSMMDCPKEGCAAWQNGRCRYASVDLKNE